MKNFYLGIDNLSCNCVDSDPTYDLITINKNPVWRVAFVISECLNDTAPLGWGSYIWVAEKIVADEKQAKKKKRKK
jgi:hypothetical protein